METNNEESIDTNSQSVLRAVHGGRGGDEAHERGPPLRGDLRDVVRLAWPITISMLSFTAMSLADTLFVGRLGTEPLAAVGLSTSVTFLALAFGMGIMGGVKVAVAQRTGAGDVQGARTLGWQGLWLALALGAPVAGLVFVGAPLFRLLGAEGELLEMADAYFAWRVVGAPLTFGFLALKAFFEGRGDTRTPMVANLIANGLNVALDPIFIFGWGWVPALGVGGAAAATVIALGVAALYLATRAVDGLWRSGVSRRIDRGLLRSVWRFGSPMGTRQVLGVGAWVLLVSVLARVGAVDLAAHVMVIRIVSVSFLPGYAIGDAASVLVGQLVGAGARGEVHRAARNAMGLGIGVMAAFGLLFVLVPGLLVAPFGVEPEVAAMARRLLLVAAAMQVFDAVAMVAQGALNGAGDSRFVMVTTVVGSWCVQLPLAVLLAVPLGMGAVGAWLGIAAEVAVVAAISWHRLRGDRWLPAPTGVLALPEAPDVRVPAA